VKQESQGTAVQTIGSRGSLLLVVFEVFSFGMVVIAGGRSFYALAHAKDSTTVVFNCFTIATCLVGVVFYVRVISRWRQKKTDIQRVTRWRHG